MKQNIQNKLQDDGKIGDSLWQKGTHQQYLNLNFGTVQKGTKNKQVITGNIAKRNKIHYFTSFFFAIYI